MKTFYLYIILLLIGCVACKTDALSPKEELPAATQEGLNTFGCLVNGEVWVPDNSINPSIHKLTGYYSESYFYLRANKTENSSRETFGLDHEYIDDTGTYSLVPSKEEPIIQAFFKDSENRFSTDDITDAGEIHVTYLNVSERVISGTFYFDAVNDEGEVVEIRDGRFDLKY